MGEWKYVRLEKVLYMTEIFPTQIEKICPRLPTEAQEVYMTCPQATEQQDLDQETGLLILSCIHFLFQKLSPLPKAVLEIYDSQTWGHLFVKDVSSAWFLGVFYSLHTFFFLIVVR